MITLMRVTGLSHDPEGHTSVLLLETATGTSRLGLVMPMNEANRLARVLGLTRCRCTPVYGLIDRLVWHLAASVASAILDARNRGDARPRSSGGPLSRCPATPLT